MKLRHRKTSLNSKWTKRCSKWSRTTGHSCRTAASLTSSSKTWSATTTATWTWPTVCTREISNTFRDLLPVSLCTTCLKSRVTLSQPN